MGESSRPGGRLRSLALLTFGHSVEHWYVGMVAPLLPFLARDLGMNLAQLGLLLSLRSLMSAASSAGSGLVMDTLGGGKAILVVAMAGLGVLYAAVGLAPSFPFFVAALVLTGLFTHLWHPPAMSALGAQFSDRRGFALGIHGTGAAVGGALAPLATGALLLSLSWRQVLVANLLPGLLAALLIAWLLAPVPAGGGGERGSFRTRLHEGVLTNPSLFLLTFLFGIRALTQRGLEVLIPFFVVRALGLSPLWAGFYLFWFSLSSSAGEPLAGWLSDRVGRRGIIGAGMVAGGAAIALIASQGHGFALAALLGVVGFSLLSLRSVLFAYALEVTPPGTGGTAVGVMFTGNQLFAAAGPFVCGLLADRWGLAAAFVFLGLVCLASSLSLLWMQPGRRAAGEVAPEVGPALSPFPVSYVRTQDAEPPR